MPSFNLLTLHLHAPLSFRGIENPPFAGFDVPESLAAFLSGSEATPTADSHASPAEAQEEVFVFDAEDLIGFDPDEGPGLSSPLPSPRFYGVSCARGDSPPEGGCGYNIPPGGYNFMQWRPQGRAELVAGIEWFARECWWEQEGASGPYFIRRLIEDGKIATQLFRAK
jgi:hypothetical protein